MLRRVIANRPPPATCIFTVRANSFQSECSLTVSAIVEIGLGSSAPPGLSETLERVPGVRVRRTKGSSYVRHGEIRVQLRILPRPSFDRADAEQNLDDFMSLAARPDEDAVSLVAASFLPRSLRAALAANGISYADARGDIHLVAPGIFVHVDGRATPTRPRVDARLGQVGVRAVQTLVENAGQTWSIADLAASAHVSAGQAHRVMLILEESALVEAEGIGPRKRRRVRDAGALLDWLAAQPTSRRVGEAIGSSLYARTPQDLAIRASNLLDAAGIGHAFTASLAATLLGAGPTAVPRATLRIAPEAGLESAARALGAEVTERGANLTLWADTGLVGTVGRRRHEDVWLAPETRIYLDLLGDRRGEDAAAHFRELVLKV